MIVFIAIAVICATTAVIILYNKYGMPKATAGLGFLGIAGLAPLFFKKDSGPVICDERDREIARRSA